MTPLQYYNAYRHLQVDLVGWVKVYNVDVHEYRNARDKFEGTSEISTDHDVTVGVGAWAKLSRAVRKHGEMLRKNVFWLRLPLPTEWDPTPERYLEEVDLAKL